jgi:hypothetical protein
VRTASSATRFSVARRSDNATPCSDTPRPEAPARGIQGCVSRLGRWVPGEVTAGSHSNIGSWGHKPKGTGRGWCRRAASGPVIRYCIRSGASCASSEVMLSSIGFGPRNSFLTRRQRTPHRTRCLHEPVWDLLVDDRRRVLTALSVEGPPAVPPWRGYPYRANGAAGSRLLGSAAVADLSSVRSGFTPPSVHSALGFTPPSFTLGLQLNG